MNIVIANRQRTKKINTRLLKQIVKDVFDELAVTDAELGISLVAAREMALVNETFLKHTGSTDVITFDHSAPKARMPDGRQPPLHGELFICLDDAVDQADQFRTSWQAEIVRYVIHGILHLQGYDDLKPALRRKMKREENRVVKEISGRFELRRLDAHTSKPARLEK